MVKKILLGVVVFVVLAFCGYAGYALYVLANYNPTNQYDSGRMQPPIVCLPGLHADAVATCALCENEAASGPACLHQAFCIDRRSECLRRSACLEQRPPRIDYCD